MFYQLKWNSHWKLAQLASSCFFTTRLESYTPQKTSVLSEPFQTCKNFWKSNVAGPKINELTGEYQLLRDYHLYMIFPAINLHLVRRFPICSDDFRIVYRGFPIIFLFFLYCPMIFLYFPIYVFSICSNGFLIFSHVFLVFSYDFPVFYLWFFKCMFTMIFQYVSHYFPIYFPMIIFPYIIFQYVFHILQSLFYGLLIFNSMLDVHHLTMQLSISICIYI